MKNVDILKAKDKQIDQLIELVNRLIKTIELQSTQIQTVRTIGPNDDQCTDGGPHEYPNPWHSVSPAPCNKCGKQAPSYPVTWSGGTITDGTNPYFDSGHSNTLINGRIMNDSNTLTQKQVEDLLNDLK